MRTLQQIIITALMAVMICSCSDNSKAKSLVDDFMENNMTDTVKVTDVAYSQLDSTTRMNDSIVDELRKEAHSIPLLKEGVTFLQKPSPTLRFMNIRYRTQNDSTLRQQTFYFDREVNGIVVVKNY
ncbi:MAG: hypothetical protein SOY06_00800 [Prevotella sp.]|nr:hypothetical protein [Bacteroidales bacterium]MDY4228377.1 hypothetical protein [Prevotella sp.]